MGSTEVEKKEKNVRVIVIARGLKYNRTDKKGDTVPIKPDPGDMLTLPLTNARIEKKTGNVRFLFKSEKEALNKKIKKKE